MKTKSILVCGFLFSASTVHAWDGLVVMGDSISTGAAAHSALTFDAHVLWDVMAGNTSVAPQVKDIPSAKEFGIGDTLEAPRRLWPSQRENDGATGWVWLHAIQALSRTALDTEEYSYSYLLGRGLGFAPNKIWLAGDNGTRADHGVLHAARILEAGEGELPSHVVMFYTGNDLCAQSWEAMTDAVAYGEALREAILYLARNGRNGAGKPTIVYLPAFLPITSLLFEPSISSKVIKFYGSEISCGEARTRMFAAPNQVVENKPEMDARFPAFAQFMPPNPALLCPTLFSRAAEEVAKQAQLANRMRAYREVQQSVAASVNKDIANHPEWARMEVRFIESTADLHFIGEDVAGDCFHLSTVGHAKVARALLQRMR